MAKIELELSIYPIVWAVVMEDTGLPPEYGVTESLWASEERAFSRAYVLERKTSHRWKVVKVAVDDTPE